MTEAHSGKGFVDYAKEHLDRLNEGVIRAEYDPEHPWHGKDIDVIQTELWRRWLTIEEAQDNMADRQASGYDTLLDHPLMDEEDKKILRAALYDEWKKGSPIPYSRAIDRWRWQDKQDN